MRHSFILAIAAIALIFVSTSATSQAPPTPAADNSTTIAAIVNGQEITEAMVSRGLKTRPGWSELSEKDKAEVRQEIVDFLIDQTLIEQHLVNQKFTVDAKELQAGLDKVNEELKRRNSDYAKELKEIGMSDAEFKTHLTAQLRWEKYRDSKLPDKELRAFFEANKVMFDGTQVKARHILLTPNPKDAKEVEKAKTALIAIKAQLAAHAETILAKLPPDADKLTKDQARGAAMEDAFSKAAETHSVCPTKSIGGDLGWFPRISRYDEKVVQTAFNLKPYEVSDIVPTDFGLHLIMMTGRRDGQPVQFEKAREFVRDYCESKLRVALVEQLRKDAKIHIENNKS
jgi:peptidyl-prolyl cis-trans isomerase C